MDIAPRSRCRRKTLTTHKSGFQPLFSPPGQFLTDGRQSGCCRGLVKMSCGPPSCHLRCHLCGCSSSARNAPDVSVGEELDAGLFPDT